MSRIDEALKRLAGVNSPAPRTQGGLDRFAAEEPSQAVISAKNPLRLDSPKVSKFSVQGPRSVERVTPVAVEPPPQAAPPPPEPRATAEQKEDDDALVDTRQIFDYARFALHSLKRHKRLAGLTVAAVLALTVAAGMLLPRTYHVQTKLFAQRNAVMAALSNPGRAIPWDADAPTRAAAETVLRRDNLITLITQTDLIRQWEARRAPVLKLKDWVVRTVTQHTPTPDEQLDSLVGLLEARMIVNAGAVGDSTLTIDLEWPDAEMAYRLVQGAQQAFLEARQVAETAAIGESIGILERYSASLNDGIKRTLAELERTQPRAGAPARIESARAAAPSTSSVASTIGIPALSEALDSDPELNRLKGTISAKRVDLTRMEEARQRQVSEAQTKLAHASAVFTGNHPTLLSAQQNLAALSQEQPQIVALAAEVEELQAEYDSRVADATDLHIKQDLARRSALAAAAAVSSAPAPVILRPSEPLPATGGVTPTQFAGLRLRSELTQLQSVLERTDGARIELAVSQAAFKYRYTVIRPAQIPREPVFPNVKILAAAGLLGSLVLALALAVAVDLLSGRIHETWQIERSLGLPVLGTLKAL